MAGRFERKKKRGFAVWAAVVLLIGLVLTGCREEQAVSSEQIALRLQGEDLVLVADTESAEEIKKILSGAKDIGYEPKTYILGPQLVYTDVDGQEVFLELDLDSDLFRYGGRFFDYGPGNDNNAMPKLLDLLGLEDWPEEVKEEYPQYFASVEEQTVPINGSYRQQSVYMDLWYPDWYYVKIQEEYALAILDALRQENPVQTDREKVAVEDSIFTIHIAYDDGREYDLAYIGEDMFLLWEGGTETVYGFSGTGFRETVDEMIALSKALAE